MVRLKDRDLLLAILQKAPLSEGQREIFANELAKVETMGLKMPAVVRRHAEARAVFAGILPSRGTHKQLLSHAQNDVYSTKHTLGTEFAERLLTAPIPAPIRKKAS